MKTRYWLFAVAVLSLVMALAGCDVLAPANRLTQVPMTVLPPGLIFSAAGGSWRVGADGQPIQLSADPNANLSPDALQGGSGQELLFRGAGGISDDIWISFLSTGEERNLNPGGRIRCPCRRQIIATQ